MRKFFMTTPQLGFSIWERDDLNLAKELWGDENVTQYICAKGKFTLEEVEERLKLEINNQRAYQVQYWCIFEMESGKFIGCCGLRPYNLEENIYEVGVHLCQNYWGKGYAKEALLKVIEHAQSKMKIEKLFAGHNPHNEASRQLLLSVGFEPIGAMFYEPTGLDHPSYLLQKRKLSY